MAAIIFNAAHQKERVRELLDTVLTAFRETLDAVVSNRMRRSAAEAEHVRARQPFGHTNAIDETATIAVRLMSSDLSRRQAPRRSPAAIAPESVGSGTLPVEAPPTVTAQFRPLDAGIVNEAIPAFFIGRNKEGFWIARDVKGRIGGIFLLENSALSFAKKNSRPAGCATIFPSERFELDLENNGNPLVAHLGPLMRLATPHRRPAAAFIRKMAQAITRRFKDFHVL